MYDVIIVGSGPAGSTAAKHLSECGYNVLVTEKHKLPRYKSCSGVLIKKSMELIKSYFNEDIPLDTMCTPADNHGMIFTDDKGQEFRFEQDGINVWRSSFDNWLISRAHESGAEIADKTAVLSLSENKDYVSAVLKGKHTYTVTAKYVINCEGVVGSIKRKLINEPCNFITTFQTFNIGTINLDPHYFYAYLQPELSEYDAWFNVKDDMLVLGVSVKDQKNIPYFYSKFIDYMKSKHGLNISKEIKREKWLMPHIHPGCNINYGIGKILFGGETAGFLNPMGEGISAAMESGYYAADAVAANFNNLNKIYIDYKEKTNSLKTYMKRQWNFVANMAETFSEMKL